MKRNPLADSVDTYLAAVPGDARAVLTRLPDDQGGRAEGSRGHQPATPSPPRTYASRAGGARGLTFRPS